MLLTHHLSGSVWEYGVFLVETLVALAVIAAAGYLVVRLSKQGLKARGHLARMRVLERLPLEHRRTLHLVQVDQQTFLIGTSENAVHLVTALGSQSVDAVKPENGDAK